MSDRLVLSKSIHQFTEAERFSLASMLTGKMKEWNLSTQHRLLGPLAARIVGVVGIVFAMAGDVIIHTGMFLGKSFIVLPAKPFALCLKVPKDLDLSSPLIHLTNAASRLSKIVVLPFICLLDPNRAHGAAEFEGISLKEIQSLQAIVKDLNDKIEKQERELQISHGSMKKSKDSTMIDSLTHQEGGKTNREAYPYTPTFRYPNDGKGKGLKGEGQLNEVRKRLDFNTPKKGEEGAKGSLRTTSHKRRNSFNGTPSKSQVSLPSEFLEAIKGGGVKLRSITSEVSFQSQTSAQKKVLALSKILDSMSLELPTPSKSPVRKDEFHFTPIKARKVEPLDEKGIQKDLENKWQILEGIKRPRILTEFENFAQEMHKYFCTVGSQENYFPKYTSLWKENYAGQHYSLQDLAGAEVRVLEDKKKNTATTDIASYIKSKQEFYQKFKDQVARLKIDCITQSTKPTLTNSTYSYKFFSVETEARKHIAETNKIIHRIASEEHLEVDTLDELILEANAIKAEMSEASASHFSPSSKFEAVSKIIKALNSRYYRGKIFKDTDLKKQALRDLTLINIKTELEKNPMFTINALQLIRQTTNETIASIEMLEKSLEEAEMGLITDQEKLKNLKSILDLLNQGLVK